MFNMLLRQFCVAAEIRSGSQPFDDQMNIGLASHSTQERQTFRARRFSEFDTSPHAQLRANRRRAAALS
jgi:hypothetical protein